MAAQMMKYLQPIVEKPTGVIRATYVCIGQFRNVM